MLKISAAMSNAFWIYISSQQQ